MQKGMAGVALQSTSKLQASVHTPVTWPLGSSEVQNCVVGQLLRPAAREQPSLHLWVVPSQMRPEVALPQSLSLAQPQKTALLLSSWQAWPSGLATQPLLLAVWPLPATVHKTHLPCAKLQAGVALLQSVALVMLHWRQLPSLWQAGRAATVQLASLAQGRQFPVGALQKGVVKATPSQSAVLAQARQPVAGAQMGVSTLSAPHCALVEQVTQAPPAQIGVAG
jgi:hypothetical protein